MTLLDAARTIVTLRKEGNEWHGPCPTCGTGDDRFFVVPSGGLDGTGRYACRRCDESGNAVDFLTRHLGVSEARARLDLGLDGPGDWARRPWSLGIEARRFEYAAPDGDRTLDVVRYEVPDDHPLAGTKDGKTYRPAPPAGRPGKRPRVHRHLYRAPAVEAAVAAGEPVLVCEGEPAAEAIASLGVCGTTAEGGAGKWYDSDADALTGADVVVLPDNDAAGEDHLRAVVAGLQGRARRVRVLRLPGLPPGGDAVEFVARGGTADDLLALLDAASELPPAEPPATTSPAEGLLHPSVGVAAPEVLPLTASAPAIPARVFALLPEGLRDACDQFSAWHERDVFLSALVGALSAALPNVRFQYGRTPRYLSPHLYFFLLANGAGGKGVADFAFAWLDAVDELLVAESEAELAAWARRRDRYEKAKRSKDAEAEPPGPEPRPRYIVEGDDITLGGLYDGLHANDGVALLSTEADALSGSNRREFGGFSYLLRKAFHHERATESRRGTGRRTIKRPRLAVVLTGTPDQFGRLLESVEDGLFSRFAVYAFDAPTGYESQRPVASADEVSAFMEARARDVARLWETLRGREGPLYFDVSADLWDRVDAAFRELDGALFSRPGVSPYLAATVKRGAVIAFRIAAVLGVWRAFETGVDLDTAPRLEASAEDVEAAVLLATTYAEHALAQARDHGGGRASEAEMGGADRMTAADRTFLDALPACFGRAEMLDAADRAGISEATSYRRVDAWISRGLLRKERQGAYSKLHSANTASPENPARTPTMTQDGGGFSHPSQSSQHSHAATGGDGVAYQPSSPSLAPGTVVGTPRGPGTVTAAPGDGRVSVDVDGLPVSFPLDAVTLTNAPF